MKKQPYTFGIETIALLCLMFLFSNWDINPSLECNTIKQKKNLSNLKSDTENVTYEIEKDTINCTGNTFDVYPDLNSIKNSEFAELLEKLKPVDISKAYYPVLYDPLNEQLLKYFYEEALKIGFKSYGYIDFLNRVDGEKLIWTPVALLPTNGKFIMMILANWEDVTGYEYDPPSTGYFLFTFKLTGELQSMVYLYGSEEFIPNDINKEILSSIIGKAYCLNTNKPFVRKAIYWDEFIDRGGFIGGTLEIKEMKYIITEDGMIQAENEEVIFPKKEVKWVDRKGTSFSFNSDTVRKMLGEIK
jgi:hypothetical protein